MRVRTIYIAIATLGGAALMSCSKTPNPETAAAPASAASAGASASGVAASALTSQLSDKFGLTPAQADAGVGTVLGYAKGKLPAAQYDQVAASVPGAADKVQAADSAGALSTPMTSPDQLTAALGKVGIPPDMAKQFVPAVTDAISKFAGPEVGGMLKQIVP